MEKEKKLETVGKVLVHEHKLDRCALWLALWIQSSGCDPINGQADTTRLAVMSLKHM